MNLINSLTPLLLILSLASHSATPGKCYLTREPSKYGDVIQIVNDTGESKVCYIKTLDTPYFQKMYLKPKTKSTQLLIPVEEKFVSWDCVTQVEANKDIKLLRTY